MNETFSTPTLRTTFKFPFQEKDWILPFVIGIALIFSGMIVPIIPVIFVYGYIAEVMRIAIKGEELILPQWKNWGKLFLDGIRCLGVALIYLGPGMLVSIIGFMAYFLMLIISIAISASSPSYNPTNSGLYILTSFGAMAILFISMALGTILLFAGAIPLPAALANYIAHDKFGSAFHIREWTKIIGRDKWGYLVAWLLMFGMISAAYLNFLITYWTFILCIFGFLLVYPVFFYILLISATLFGQSYRQGALLSAPNDPLI